jgi:hypothetical protein
MSPYRFRIGLLEEVKRLGATQRHALARECLQALNEAEQPRQPIARWRIQWNWADSIGLIWAIIVVLMVVFAQQPGGFERSLQSENIGEWGNLLFRVVLIPWAILRLLSLLVFYRRY